MICWSAKSERGSAQRRTQQTKEACDISCLSCCPLRHDLSGGVLAEAARQDARQSIAEHPGVRRAVAVEHARFIEQQMRGILLEGQIAIPQRGERNDNVVTRVDLQDRLPRALD